jgi:hypothetical protein
LTTPSTPSKEFGQALKNPPGFSTTVHGFNTLSTENPTDLKLKTHNYLEFLMFPEFFSFCIIKIILNKPHLGSNR